MINLLPKEKKIHLKTEYRLRFTAVSLISAAVVIFFTIASFLPLYAAFSSRATLLDVSTATNVSTEAQQKTTRVAVEQTRRQLSVLEDKGAHYNIATGLVPEIVSRKGGTEIEGISYNATDENIIIRTNGMAPQRDDLTGFIRALEESGLFTEVKSPVSNLVREENLVFSLELVIEDL